MSAQAGQRITREMTWARAILIDLVITAFLLVTLAWIPSYWLYFADSKINFFTELTKLNVETWGRVRDLIAMGFQSVVFGGVIATIYILMERRRRKLGEELPEEVQGYHPGK